VYLPPVRELFVEYAHFLASIHGEVCFQDLERELAEFPGTYGPPDGCLLLAFDETRLAGCVAARKIGEGICEMKRLYVRPEFRGQGVGRALARAIIDEARQLGYARMRLDTLLTMTEAQALYRTLGFYSIGPYGQHATSHAVFMELNLT
jgi:ribosomal protein S18 acetylase RimI-like enzyme